MKKRIMQHPGTERRMINGALWLVLACVIAAVLTSCSPYAVVGGISDTATPSPSATVTAAKVVQMYNSPTPRPASQTCTVTGTVYLRPDPSRARAPLAILRAGQILEILERGAWLKVRTGSQTGHVYGDFCQVAP